MSDQHPTITYVCHSCGHETTSIDDMNKHRAKKHTSIVGLMLSMFQRKKKVARG